MRLIDADALYQKIADKIYKDCNAPYGRYCRVEDILQDIEYTSTVVDLVFCKDCLYFIEYGDKYKPVEGAFGVCWKKCNTARLINSLLAKKMTFAVTEK